MVSSYRSVLRAAPSLGCSPTTSSFRLWSPEEAPAEPRQLLRADRSRRSRPVDTANCRSRAGQGNWPLPPRSGPFRSSCRRSQPIPQDFLQSLHTHQLSLRSLVPHLKPPVPPRKSQYSLQSDGSDEDGWPKDPDILSSLLSEGDNHKMTKYIPKHFPALPSMHTYQATAEFIQREEDPRKIRERATEEGRLGEEALRKLATHAHTTPIEATKDEITRPSAKEKRKRLWLETMEAVTKEHSEGVKPEAAYSMTGNGNATDAEMLKQTRRGIITSAVNADKKYWRKPVT